MDGGACTHRSSANPPPTPPPQAQLALVSEALRAATQRLCRSLRDNLNVADNMAKVRGSLHARNSALPHKS